MGSIIRAAAVQLNSTEDTDANLTSADRLVRAAVARGAELVVLPEKWNVLGRADVMAAHAQTLDGSAASWAAGIAAELGIDLVAGSIVEHVEGQERTSNTCVHYNAYGKPVAIYRKLHMFDVEVDGTRYAESEREAPGDQVVTSTVGDAGLGLSICYDVRFPELYRAFAGVELITVPAAFTLATTRDHWEVLLRARAIENQAFVIAPNQIGAYPPGPRSGGRSAIIDPWGVVLGVAPDDETVVVADCDLGLLSDVRRRLPALTHRRAREVYGHRD